MPGSNYAGAVMVWGLCLVLPGMLLVGIGQAAAVLIVLEKRTRLGTTQSN